MSHPELSPHTPDPLEHAQQIVEAAAVEAMPDTPSVT